MSKPSKSDQGLLPRRSDVGGEPRSRTLAPDGTAIPKGGTHQGPHGFPVTTSTAFTPHLVGGRLPRRSDASTSKRQHMEATGAPVGQSDTGAPTDEGRGSADIEPHSPNGAGSGDGLESPHSTSISGDAKSLSHNPLAGGEGGTTDPRLPDMGVGGAQESARPVEPCPNCGAERPADERGIATCFCGWNVPWIVGLRGARCRAINQSGTQCKSKTWQGSEHHFCYFHEPGNQASIRAGQSKGGHLATANRRSRLDRPGAPAREFKTEEDILQLLGDAANQVCQGEIDLQQAETIRKFAADMLKIIQKTDPRERGGTSGADRTPTNGAWGPSSEGDFLAEKVGVRDGPSS